MSDRFLTKRWGVILLLVIALVAIGGWFLFFGAKDVYRTAVPLDVSAYITGANNLRGNTYKIEGEVTALLAWSPSGRLVSFGVEGSSRAIPLLFSSEFDSVNIQKGQKLKVLVVVEDKGVLHAKKLAKL